jgi:dTDP-glucose pyrophosphorylase
MPSDGVEPVQAVVPAAGEGTRLRPLTADRPKGLVEVAGQPLLAHVFDALGPVASECVVVVGYRGDQLRDQFGPRYRNLDLTYVRQSERRGLADAVLQAEPHIDGDFVSLNGDNVLRADLGTLVARHRDTGADVTAFVERVSRERAKKGAVLELAEKSNATGTATGDTAGTATGDTAGTATGGDEADLPDGTGRNRQPITGIVEKPSDPPSRLVPRGCYAFSPAIFDACRLVTPGSTGERELTDAVDLLLAAGRRFETVPLAGWCYNVNTPADCERAAQQLADDSRG